MNYREAVEYILSFADYERIPRAGIVWDLARMEKLLSRLGNPERAAPAVHVAGTKGKGSTSAMIASILTSAGFRAGLYTSPHLLTILERVQIDGQNIPEAAFAGAASAVRPQAEAVNRDDAEGELTTYELLTALAFVHFRDSGVDFQVLETGLGGRLDATNVVTPQVSVITSISYDHTDVLGDTLTKIATEKAGIIKKDGTVVSAPQSHEAMEVIEERCRARKARLVRIGKDILWNLGTADGRGQAFTLEGLLGSYELYIPLLGEYQVENAACAVAAAELLSSSCPKIDRRAITKGLCGINWPGRLQTLREQPLVVVDGAHNAYSARRLVEALKEYYSFREAFLIFGASSDKQVSGMVEELVKLTENIILTTSRHPRAVAAQSLADEFSRAGVSASTFPDVASALKNALTQAQPEDLIIATGSIFVIAEVMEELSE